MIFIINYYAFITKCVIIKSVSDKINYERLNCMENLKDLEELVKELEKEIVKVSFRITIGDLVDSNLF